MPMKKVTLRRWEVVVAFAAITAAFVIQGIVLKHQQNEIQSQRVASCAHTYEGIREVFRPFFRPKKVRTAKEQRDIDKFNRIVDQLKRGCKSQVRLKGAS